MGRSIRKWVEKFISLLFNLLSSEWKTLTCHLRLSRIKCGTTTLRLERCQIVDVASRSLSAASFCNITLSQKERTESHDLLFSTIDLIRPEARDRGGATLPKLNTPLTYNAYHRHNLGSGGTYSSIPVRQLCPGTFQSNRHTTINQNCVFLLLRKVAQNVKMINYMPHNI